MDLSFWQAVFLGVVQGLTEFLPVSSSGHLAVAQWLLGVQLPGVAFEIVLHVGTLAAVFAVYGKDLVAAAAGVLAWLGARWRGDGAETELHPGAHLALLMVVGTLPAAVIGLAAEDAIAASFERPTVVAACWLFTGILLWWVNRRQGAGRALAQAGWLDALVVGSFQALALMPGISRSGSTLAAGLMLGLARPDAARFSFLLSVPAILGGAVLSLPELRTVGAGAGWLPLLVGGAVAAATGYAAIRWLLRWLATDRLHWFAYYLWAIAILLLFYVSRHL